MYAGKIDDKIDIRPNIDYEVQLVAYEGDVAIKTKNEYTTILAQQSKTSICIRFYSSYITHSMEILKR